MQPVSSKPLEQCLANSKCSVTHRERINACGVCMFIYKIHLCITGEAVHCPNRSCCEVLQQDSPGLCPDCIQIGEAKHRAKEGLGTKRGQELSNFNVHAYQ